MKVSVSGIERLTAEILKKSQETVTTARRSIVNKAVDALKNKTPVDTGEARDGWHIDERGNIANNVEHIAALNDGHSNQAPTHFIESTVLSLENVRPNGIIVTRK